MDFRNKKSKNSKSAIKNDITFVKLNKAVGSVLQIEDGDMWLKSGKYDAPSVSIQVNPDAILSDWMRKITLRNVELSIEENKKGYPELIISGHSDEDDTDDLPF